MSDQSNNNESENTNNNNTNYNDMINPPSWSVEPEQLEGLVSLIDSMTVSLENQSNLEDLSGNNPFSEILSDFDSNDNVDSNDSVDSIDIPALQELETIFQDFDIQESSDILEDTVFQGLHIEIPTVQTEENGGAAAPAPQEDGENAEQEHE